MLLFTINLAIAADETIEPEFNGIGDDLPPLDRRIEKEREALNNPFSIAPHKPNYILPLTYNVIDNFNREGLGIEVDFSLPSELVIRSLDRIIELIGNIVDTALKRGAL